MSVAGVSNTVSSHTGTVLATMQKVWPGTSFSHTKQLMFDNYNWLRGQQAYELCLMQDRILCLDNLSFNDIQTVLVFITCN